MSFLASISSKSKPVQSEINNQLTKEEIQLLLEVMKNSTFKGEFVELFYSTVVKLQNQYINIPEN